MLKNNKLAIIIAYFLIYVVWGSTYYFIGVSLKSFPTFLLGTFRFSVAGLILLLICRYNKERIFRKGLILRSAVSGIVLLFIDQMVIMLAQRYVSSSLVAIIAASVAIWIMFLDIPMWKQNFRRLTTVLGVLIGFVGVGMLYAEQAYMEEGTSPDAKYGIMILIFGCISWSLGTLYAKYYSSAEEEVDGFAGSAWQMLWAGLLFGIGAVIFGETETFSFSQVSLPASLSLVYLISLGSLLAYSAYVWLLKVRPATEVATHAYVNPVVAVIIGGGFGGEHITGIQILGLAVILFSVLLISKK